MTRGEFRVAVRNTPSRAAQRSVLLACCTVTRQPVALLWLWLWLVFATAMLLTVAAPVLGRYPHVSGDDSWNIAVANSLATTSVYGSPLYVTFSANWRDIFSGIWRSTSDGWTDQRLECALSAPPLRGC